MNQPDPSVPFDVDLDLAIVGAGFAGLYMLHRARQLGLRARVYDAATDIGGTWFWNRYPGARCDAESIAYSYSFSEELQQEWTWSERYAQQPEILEYINFVADRLDLRTDVQLETEIESVVYRDEAGRWTLTTNDGATIDARFVVMATGCLSRPLLPEVRGRDSFLGEVFHTGNWPMEPVDFSGKRVAIIGTGSSGVQLTPRVAEQAEQLFVFQRTPHFAVPCRNRPYGEEEQRRLKAEYPQFREHTQRPGPGIIPGCNPDSALAVDEEERQRVFEETYSSGGAGRYLGSFRDVMTDPQANEKLAEFVRAKIRERVDDQDVAAKLLPQGYPFGAKRVILDTDYYETYNRPNVELVDAASSPIEEIIPTGIRAGGVDIELDAIAFATGFDAMTGALLAIDIRGRDGISLREEWEGGPGTFLGIAVAGFPNFFTVTGPGSPSVLSNMVDSIELHVEWISDLIKHLLETGTGTVEASREAQAQWVEHGNQIAESTLFSKGASWYVGANVPGKPRVFMAYVGGVGVYREVTEHVAGHGYEGLVFDADEAEATPLDVRQLQEIAEAEGVKS